MSNSLEDYLEAILVLMEKSGEVHSVDVARYLSFSKPSVCRAVRELVKQKYIIVDGEHCLLFTPEGRVLAEKVYERHCFFLDLLLSIGVEEKVAEADACKIEHVVSDETFEKLKGFAEKHILPVTSNMIKKAV